MCACCAGMRAGCVRACGCARGGGVVHEHAVAGARKHAQTPMCVQAHGIARACMGGWVRKHLQAPDVCKEAPPQPEAGLPGGGLSPPEMSRARAGA